jgi:predicted kinase
MKHLQLSPPLLIITMGLPGSGKSFFARQFAELYSLPRISEDRIRFELFEKPLFNDDEADIINRVSFYMLEQAMQTERTVVFEGSSLTSAQRKAAYELARSNGYRALVVWLQTDLETSAQRAATRDRRNPDSKYAFEVNNATFNKVKSTLERPTEKELVVVVSGKHAFKSQCLTVLRKITSIYSDSISKGDFGVATKPVSQSTPKPQSARTNQRFIQ